MYFALQLFRKVLLKLKKILVNKLVKNFSLVLNEFVDFSEYF